MEVLPSEGGPAAGAAYTVVGTERTFRVNTSANTFTAIVNVTLQSTDFGVVFTFTVLAATVDSDGLPSVATQHTADVNQVCADAHVVDFRTEQEQGPSQILYNYAVIEVGTPDKAITDEVRVRMDSLNTPGTFAAIAACWARLVALGAQATV